MSTYTLYYQAPLVHANAAWPCTSQHPHPSFKFQSAEPSIHGAASALQPSGATPPTKRIPVPALRVLNGGSEVYSQLQSPLFRLPPELRNKIYEMLLCPDAIKPHALPHFRQDLSVRGFNQTCSSTMLHPAILSTCKRAAEEAEPLLYAQNIFHAHPSLLTALPHFSSPSKPVLYPAVTSKIRRWQVTLRLDTDPRFSYDDAAKSFSGAEYLEIRVWQSQFEAADWGVLKLFAGVRGVGVARVGGSIDGEIARALERCMMKTAGDEADMDLCACMERTEMLCGRCYKKVDFGGRVNEWFNRQSI
ncbi:hypothetical protein CC78DRAFT_218702 [Lojkania enalia]|uniref:2EXR domain-containing protein n=1 Tax=Lojkania enalia TaxID=147567 RepID=A0A9P4N8H1_9PLEO|nr:hypothetical protein CC78DRAFT_218702 [Didymosphaeria enalia]